MAPLFDSHRYYNASLLNTLSLINSWFLTAGKSIVNLNLAGQLLFFTYSFFTLDIDFLIMTFNNDPVTNCQAKAGASQFGRSAELFDHKKGAFTGVTGDATDRFQMVDQGTLVLDEIWEIPFHQQKTLLRVIEEKEFIFYYLYYLLFWRIKKVILIAHLFTLLFSGSAFFFLSLYYI